MLTSNMIIFGKPAYKVYIDRMFLHQEQLVEFLTRIMDKIEVLREVILFSQTSSDLQYVKQQARILKKEIKIFEDVVKQNKKVRYQMEKEDNFKEVGRIWGNIQKEFKLLKVEILIRKGVLGLKKFDGELRFNNFGNYDLLSRERQLIRIFTSILNNGSTGIVERTYPGLKDAKRRTILDNFKFHIFFVSITICPANDIFSLEIRGFDKSQREFMITIRQDTIKMAVNDLGKLAIGFEPGPFQGVFPILPEFQSPGSGGIRPEMTKAFFQEMSPAQTGGSAQKFVKRFSGFTPDVGQAGEQDEFFTGEYSLKPFIDTTQFLMTNRIKRLEQMPDDVELVVENGNPGTMSSKAIDKSSPHVHNTDFNVLGSGRTEPLPELFNVFFLTPLTDIDQFWTPRSIHGTDHVPVIVSPPDGDFIDSQSRNPIQQTVVLGFLQFGLVNILYALFIQTLQYSHSLIGHHLAQLIDQRPQPYRDPAISLNKRQLFNLQPTLRAQHPILHQPQTRDVLPQTQVLNDSFPISNGVFDFLMTTAADKLWIHSSQIQDHTASVSATVHGGFLHNESLNPQQSCEIIFLHLVWPPSLNFPKGLYPTSGYGRARCFFYTQILLLLIIQHSRLCQIYYVGFEF
jgi:hypothetical protein